ncbi:MAG: hypothetical protein JOZ13_13950 [Alphaproteobacteria bacterium]|nr:hypothetical protein [Alphaproteobacteria bacterium]
MPNRNLTPEELVNAKVLLEEVRRRLAELADGDEGALFAYRRKIAKELQYDERGKPGERRLLKARKIGEQGGKCPLCDEILPEKNSVLDRLSAMDGYTLKNTRVLCPRCDTNVQRERGYK